MFSLKPFLGQSKAVNRDLVVVSLICGIAYLAGKEKHIQVFKSANLGGRIAAATTASLGLGVASKVLERSEGDKQSIEALVTKVLAITMSCVVLTSIASKQAPKLEISFADAGKFAFFSASMMLASEIQQMYFFAPSDSPEKPHNLSDRIALIRNKHCKTAAQITYNAITTVSLGILSACARVGSACYLLFSKIQVIGSIPSYARGVLFPEVTPRKQRSEEIASETHQFLNRILNAPINSYQKQQIRQIFEGERSPQEETAFIEKLFEQRAFEEAGHRTLLNFLIKKGKEAVLEENQVLLTPLQQLQGKHQKELDLFSTLKTHAKRIDAPEVERWVNNQSEQRYLAERTELIRGELPNIDGGGALWGQCLNANNLEAAGLLQGQIDQRIKDLTSRQERAEESFHPLLELEYYSLLAQRLSLSTDTVRWGRNHDHVEDFNRVVSQSLRHVHETLQTRYQGLNIPCPLPLPGEDVDIDDFFRQAQNALQGLHESELRHFEQNPAYSVQGTLIQDMQGRILSAIDNPYRREFLSIRSPEERKDRRNHVITENLFLFCLKQTPDGQQLVRLMDHYSNSEEDCHLHMVSRTAFDRLYEQALPTLQSKLYTRHEFAVDLEQDVQMVPLEQMRGNVWELDLNSLPRELNLELDFWYLDLQSVWMEHLPTYQRQELRALCTLSRHRKMNKLFSIWMLTKTELPFQRALSFAHLQIPDHSQKETQALRTIRQQYFSSRFRERVQQRMIAARQAQPQEEAFLGTPLGSIHPAGLRQANPEVECNLVPFDDGGEHYFGAPTNILALIQREDPYNRQALIEDRLAWIDRACENPVYQRFNRGALVLYAAFSNAAGDIRAAPPLKTIHQFLDLILDSSIKPLQSDNSWRKETLSCYLKLIFAGQHLPYQVTEQERKYLVQFATLAEFRLPDLLVVPEGGSRNVGVARLGHALQDTSIRLEGTEESTLQLSFQTSLLPSDEQTRSYLDALRARQGVALPKYLLGAVMDAYPMDHDEGQQAIDRALSYAFRGNLQEEIEHVNQLLRQFPPSALNVKTMAIPPHIFLLDRLLVLTPHDGGVQETVRQFNQELIQSNHAPQMLMGFAREIKRLTTFFVQDPSEERFAQLLKVKIGYQQLKAQFFDGKVALDGFLKLAVDEAEFVMTASSHFLLERAAHFDCNAMVVTLHQTEDPDPALKTYAEKAVEKVFRRQQEQGILVAFSPPFFFHFGRNDLDIVSGCVYFDGEQYLELPSELQNHPHIRSLHIHDLPYVLNEDGSFSHYTTEGHQRVAQVRIALGAFGVTIQRRLNISLEGPEEITPLQYVPLEQFDAFPSALLERMGAKEFWMAPDQTIYGYTEKGAPIFSFDPQLRTIQTASGTFVLSNDDSLQDENLRTALDYLGNILPLDEVLVREDQRLIYIPSLELTLTLKEDEAWHWVSPKISGMTLDLSRPPCPSTFVLKWEGGAARSSRQFKDQLIMLKKHLREAESQEGSSLVAKEQMDSMRKQIIATEERLAQLDKRLYVTLLPEERDSAALRETLNVEVRRLERASQLISEARDSIESRELQRQYLDVERRYHEAKQAYEACCTKRATVTYETSHLGHVKGRDLIGALFLLQEQLALGEEIDPHAWIEELANHHSKHLFDEQTLTLLQHCVDAYSEQQPLLSLYCQLLLSQHTFILFKEAGKSLSPNQKERLQRMEDTYRTFAFLDLW